MLGYAAADVMNKITPADISDPQEVIARAKALSAELATPITSLMGIFGNLEFAMQHCAVLPADSQASLKDAMSSARRLVDMVSSLLDVSRLEAGQMPVRDHGPGIPPEHHARIFEKFGQVESGNPDPRHSTGLGLTFCKLAVEAHGGQIGVESPPGLGSNFWFTLPKQPAA